MKIAIHQPQYIPWPGYFAKILQSDIFVLYDDVQYQKNSIINRNKIMINKEEQYLTLPVVKGRLEDKINEKEVASDYYFEKNFKTVVSSYCKSKYIEELKDIFRKSFISTNLSEINRANINAILNYLGVNKQILLSSDLKTKNENPTGRIIEIVKLLGADEYLSGMGGKNYLQEPLFKDNKIKLRYFNFIPKPYYNYLIDDFTQGLSIVDLIANLAKEDIIVYLKNNTEEK